MITMKELLQDKQFKEWMRQIPVLPATAKNQATTPWRVYIQLSPGGEWRYKDFPKYTLAWNWMIKRLDKYHDFAIRCRRVGFDPPMQMVKVKGKYFTGKDGVKRPLIKWRVWKPKLMGDEVEHQWCPYCRRPTIFQHFTKHKAFPKGHPIDSEVRRCVICGSSENIAPGWHYYTRRAKAMNARRK